MNIPIKVTVIIEYGDDHRPITMSGVSRSSVGYGEYRSHAPRVARSLAVEAAQTASEALSGLTGDIDAESRPEALKRLRLSPDEAVLLDVLIGWRINDLVPPGRAPARSFSEEQRQTLGEVARLGLVRSDFGRSELFYEVTEKGRAWVEANAEEKIS